METVVITGANRGIGLGLVQEFLAKNTRVIAGCRHPEKATALNELAQNAALEILPLDVADEASVSNFIASLADKPIDILINNAGTLGGDFAYRSSKAALNKVMRGLAAELKPEGILLCPIHPGWVKTDMGGANAAISVAQSAAGIYKLIDTLTEAKSGHFLAWDGEELPW